MQVDPDLMDQMNEKKRKERRPESLFSLYPEQDEFDMVERRSLAEMPAETLVSLANYKRNSSFPLYVPVCFKFTGSYFFISFTPPSFYRQRTEPYFLSGIHWLYSREQILRSLYFWDRGFVILFC
jgi:hypothetical protein